MGVIRSLGLTGLFLAALSFVALPTQGDGESALRFFTSPAASAQTPDCNYCHHCPDSELHYIDDWGVSTVEIESEPTGGQPCEPSCEDFGEECGQTLTMFAPLVDALLEGERPSVARFVESRPEQMRYVRGRNMVILLDECDSSVALAFPVREDEKALVRRRLSPHVAPAT